MGVQEPQSIAEAVGGVRGVIDSATPTVVFVAANSVGGLRPGLIAAVAAGVVIMVVRLARKEPVRQALAGFGAVAVAALFAARTGKAEGFFLPGILFNAGYGALAAISALVGHPFVGYVLATLDTRYAHWRSSPRLSRAAMLATLLWTLVFAARAGVQGWLYLHSQVGWLAAAKIGMGLPLFAAATMASILLARRAAAAEGGSTGKIDPAGEIDPAREIDAAGVHVSAGEQDEVVTVDDLPLVGRPALGGQVTGGAPQERG